MTLPDELKAERDALLANLAHMPLAMRELRQWLMWRLMPPKKPGGKPRKMPYYLSGKPRGWPKGMPSGGKPTDEQPQVEQGHELDRAALVSFDEATAALRGGMHWAGVGFAFLPGDGLIGIDIDGAIDLESGEISKRCELVMRMCPSYAERSVSGTGVHIILTGQAESFKSDAIGLEVYCGHQFFACTGQHWDGTPAEPIAADDEALSILRGMCEQANEKAKAERAEARAKELAEKQPAPAPRPAQSRPAGGGQPGDDFRRVNDAAMANLAAWVPVLFPKARVKQTVHGAGYRVASRDLGRELEEDIAITPKGIQDFGEEGGRSPIDLVMQWAHKTAHEALLWLAQLVGVTIEKRSARGAGGGHRPDPPEEGEPAGPTTDESGDGENGAPPAPAVPKKTRARRKGGGDDGDPPGSDIDWEKFRELRESFALIYGTDTVWDGQFRMIMKISNMGHAHGSDMTRLWKGGKASPRRSDAPGHRWTVHPKNVVFDPTETCDADTHVNLYAGFPTEPIQGDVGPMLELVKFLCSRTADSEEGCDEIFDWLLCWWAYPLQHKGAKLRTSVVMHGDEGAGKNFLTDTMVMMYGEYGITVGQDELEDKFNDWRSGKTLVIGDEVSSRAELVHNKNRLKALITSTEVQINPKNLPRRTEKNHINVVFNSNELQPLALDNSDRRYLVIYTPKAREFEFYRRLGEWRANGGVSAWYDYLLKYDISRFDPFAPAPMTRAKSDLIDMNRKSPERFWLEWSAGELGLPYRTCALAQAYAAYQKYAQRIGDRFPVQRNVFTAMLKRISDTMGNPARDQVMSVDYVRPKAGEPPNSKRLKEIKATRMLLVCPMPPEIGAAPSDDNPHPQSKTEWASDAYHAFEDELRRYVGRSRFAEVEEGADMG